MATLYDLESPTHVPHFTTRRPSSVRKFNGVACSNGDLLLRWEPPRNGALITGYRIERTPDGKTYETLGETTECRFVVRPVPGEGWFYRVAAFNTRGATRATWVCCYRASDRFMRGGHNEATLLMHIPVMPGVCFTVCDFGPGHPIPAFAKPSPESIRRRELAVRQLLKGSAD